MVTYKCTLVENQTFDRKQSSEVIIHYLDLNYILSKKNIFQ